MDIPLVPLGASDDSEVSTKEAKKRAKKRRLESSVVERFSENSAKLAVVPNHQQNFQAESSALSSSLPLSTLETESVVVLDPSVPLTLYLSGLGPKTRKAHVEAVCIEAVEAVGLLPSDIVEVRLAEDKATGGHRGFGFVELRIEAAARAVLDLDETELMGRILGVKPARPKHGGSGQGGIGKAAGREGAGRKFGTLDRNGLALQVQKNNERAIAAKVSTEPPEQSSDTSFSSSSYFLVLVPQ